jgi:integrase
MSRRQLPPQIKKIEVTDRKTGKTVVRYQLTVDAGINPETGRRQQVRRRYATQKQAREALAEVGNQASQGAFVPRQAKTVEEVCADYVLGKHGLKATSTSKMEYDLAPLRERHGDLPVQRLTKKHVDALVRDLVKGGTTTAKGRTRRPWKAISVNKTVQVIKMVLADAARQKVVPHNVAEYVDAARDAGDGKRKKKKKKERVDTYTAEEVERLRRAFVDDRIGQAWELALCGLRRGEVAGLKWSAVDLDAGTLSVEDNRVSAGGATVEDDTKSYDSERTLPMPERLIAVLRSAKARQAAERLALGGQYQGEYVVCNEVGEPYAPPVLSGRWQQAVKLAGVRHIKLHGARHTCATLMHLDGVPVAVIAEWIGHKDATLTTRLYIHSQPGALDRAKESLNRVVTSS